MNVDMNFFLLLKNELSLTFLRSHQNMLQAVRTAMHLDALQNEKTDAAAAEKFKQFEEYLKSEEVESADENGMGAAERAESFTPTVKERSAQFDKIVLKLLEYNERINEGKEIQVIEYIKRVDPVGKLMKTYNAQRFLRRAYFEEFKIHSFNYILLLFESVIRLLTTQEARTHTDDKGGKESKAYYSKNYRRFLENRQ